MMDNYNKCAKIILGYEGGYSNNPNDKGGTTLEGITQATYNAYRDAHGLQRIKLSKAMIGQPDWNAERDAIYRKEYWDATQCDSLPNGVDLFVYDMNVNHGSTRSIKMLQASLVALNKAPIKVDGRLGIKTLAAVQSNNDNDGLIDDISKRRQAFYQELSNYSTFGTGWTARNKNVRGIAEAWATGSIGPDPDMNISTIGGHNKALDEKIKQTSATVEQTQVATGGLLGSGVVIDAVGKSAQGMSDKLEGLQGVSHYVGHTLVFLAVLLGLYGIWTAYRSVKARNALNATATAPVAPVSPVAADDGEKDYVPPVAKPSPAAPPAVVIEAAPTQAVSPLAS